jgi:hypothetical protein
MASRLPSPAAAIEVPGQYPRMAMPVPKATPPRTMLGTWSGWIDSSVASIDRRTSVPTAPEAAALPMICAT